MNNNLITPLILTFNESPNIARTLNKLKWASRIVIVDSFSMDDTLAIIAKYPQAEVYQHHFTSFAEQCNFGLERIKTEWVLSLDADYVLDDTLVENILSLQLNPQQTAAYSVRFRYAIFGKPVRGNLYPPRKVLYAKNNAHYVNDGHGHTVVIDGDVKTLNGFIHHDDRKPFSHWLFSQDRYLKQEADKLLSTPLSKLGMNDKIRRLIIPAPFAVLFYCLILKGGVLDGWQGFYYAFQRALAEILLSLRLIEARFRLV